MPEYTLSFTDYHGTGQTRTIHAENPRHAAALIHFGVTGDVVPRENAYRIAGGSPQKINDLQSFMQVERFGYGD